MTFVDLPGQSVLFDIDVGPDGSQYVVLPHNCDCILRIAPDGTLRWHFPTGGHVSTAPTLLADGTVVVGCQDNLVYAIAPDGNKRWDFRAGDDVESTPAVGDDFEVRPSASTLSVFDTMDKAIGDLSTAGKGGAQITQDSVMNLRNVDQVMTRLSSTRADTGGTLNRIDSVTDRLGSLELQGKTERSNAEDLDMVQAISEFQSKQSGYDAALKSYAMVQRLSLFQYLNN